MIPVWRRRVGLLFRQARKPTTTCQCVTVVCVWYLVGQMDSLTASKDDADDAYLIDDTTSFLLKCLITWLAVESVKISCAIVLNVIHWFVRVLSQNERLLVVFIVLSALLYIFLLTKIFWKMWEPMVRTAEDSIHLKFMNRRWVSEMKQYKNDSAGPFCYGYIERYESEDVKFECKLELLLPAAAFSMMRFRLSSPSNLTLDSDKVTIDFRPEVAPTSGGEFATQHLKHYLNFTLFLQRLTEKDFGNYTLDCELQTMAPKYTTLKTGSNVVRLVSYEATNHWFLAAYLQIERLATTEEEVYVPPGGIVQFVLDYRIEDDQIDDVLVERLVNGEQFEDLAYNTTSGPCSLSVFQYSKFFGRGLFTKRNEHPDEGRYYKPSSFFSLLDGTSFCVHPDLYGVHTLHVRRFFFNKITGTEDFVDQQYPLVLKLAPSFAGLLGSVDANADRSFFAECWEDNRPNKSDYCWSRKKYHRPYLLIRFGLNNVTSGLGALLAPFYLVLPFYLFITFVRTFIRHGSFAVPVVNTLCQVPVDWSAFFARRSRNNPTHHVFLSYARQDRQQAHVVSTLLQTAGLSVFDCHSSPALGEPSLMAWDRAIGQSASFLILWSNRYTSDPELALQFRAMHHLMLAEEMPEERMLIVPMGGVPIPRSLGPLPVIQYYGGFAAWRQLIWWAVHVSGHRYDALSLGGMSCSLRRDVRHLVGYCQYSYQQLGAVLSDMSTEMKNAFWAVFRRHETSRQLAVLQPDNNQGNQASFSYPRIESERQVSGAASRGADTSDNGRESRRQVVSSRCSSSSHAPNTRTENRQSPSLHRAQAHSELNVPGSPGFQYMRGASVHHVFLSYCEDSLADCRLAEKVKRLLVEKFRLCVFDAVRDVLGGQVEEEAITSAAGKSASFVVVLSPAYRSHPLARRLHFRHVLLAVQEGRVSVDNVLLIRTGYTIHRAHSGTPPLSPGELSQGEEDYDLHEGLSDFKVILWTGSLAEEDYLREVTLWGKMIQRQIHGRRQRHVEADLQRHYLLERYGRYREMTHSAGLRFLHA